MEYMRSRCFFVWCTMGNLFVFLTFMGCGDKPPKEPAESLSGEQKKLSEVMAGKNESPDKHIILAEELHNLFEEWIRYDASLTSDDVDAFNRILDSTALTLSSKLFMETDPEKIVTALNEVVFEQWGMKFDKDRNDIRSLFPYTALARQKGSCVGMSMMYLLLAGKCDWPLFGVLAPDHMFIRFDNGERHRNIETLRNGEEMDSRWYRTKYSINDTSLYPLENLSSEEVMAAVRFNIGTIYFHRKEFARALHYLEQSVNVLQQFPEARGNLALVHDALGHPEKALSLLVELRKSYPDFRNVSQNIASLQLKCGKYSDALATYISLLKQFPADPDMHYGQAMALFRLHKNSEAIEAVREALSIKSDHTAALKLFDELN
jgi:tetratricopeptide (TPR) repeat protein